MIRVLPATGWRHVCFSWDHPANWTNCYSSTTTIPESGGLLRALHAFRQHGDTEDAQRKLVEADHLEPGFEHYLLQDEVVDARREVRFGAGPAERAFGCARLFLPAWRGVPGAAAWARRVLKVPPTGADPDDVPRRFPRDELRSLPLRRETWHVGLNAVPRRATWRRRANVVVWRGEYRRQEIRVATVIDQRLTEAVAGMR